VASVHSAIKRRAANGAKRRELQEQLKQAITDRDIERAAEVQAQLDVVAPKSNGRPSSSVYRDPYDPVLAAIYAGKHTHEILGEYAKEIRLDFGFLGVVPGLDDLVVKSGEAVGERPSEPLRRELVRRLFAKLHERTHGMGMLYVERGNQVLVKLYEHPEVVRMLGLPTGERPWLARRPLGDLDSDFAARWEEHAAGRAAEAAAQEGEGETPQALREGEETPAAGQDEAAADASDEDSAPDSAPAPRPARTMSSLLEDEP
jgi:hypothetical protein